MRKSLVKDVLPSTLQEMFMATQQAMLFFKDLFGTPYPYSKYDMIYVPEFNSGAMENTGCVTFSEDYLKRGQTLSLAHRQSLTNTVIHELAHHWFGNLVTMKWWDDLWLNESFATYMAYLTISKTEKLAHFQKENWVDMMGRKFTGVAADLVSSTHPVQSHLKSTSEAESVFDGISYGKGASFLKQMYKVLGHDIFRAGMHSYFKKFAWKNTVFADFVGEMSNAYLASKNKPIDMGADFNI